MVWPAPIAPPPYQDDTSMVGGIAPPPPGYGQPVGPGGPPIGLAPPPQAMPMPGAPLDVPVSDTRASTAPPPPELAPPPDTGAPDVTSGAGIAPPPRDPSTLAAGPAGGHNAPSGPRDLEAENIQAQTDLASQQQDLSAQGLIQAANDRRDREQAGRLMQVRDQQVEDNAEHDVMQAQNEARAMRVDPSHFMSSKSTAQKIAMVIGAALGGFLQVRQNRASNPFLDQINQSIHEDIQAQEANMANARESANAKQSLYGMMLRKFGDRQTAYAATTAQMFEAAKDQVAAEASKFKSPETQLEGQAAIIQLEKQRQAAYQQAVELHGKNMLDLVHAQDEHALATANVGKIHAETSKTYAETAKVGAAGAGEAVVVHGPQGSASLSLPKDKAEEVRRAQEFYDKEVAAQRQHAKAKSGSAEYKTYVEGMHDAAKRLDDTLKGLGVSDADRLAVGGGFQADNIGAPIAPAVPVDPRENQRKGIAAPPGAMDAFNEPPGLAPSPDLLDNIPPLQKPKKGKK